MREVGPDFKSGHKSSFGPTQRGKTKLDRDILKVVLPGDGSLTCVMLAGKPPGRDPGMEECAKDLKLRDIESWDDRLPRIDKHRDKYVNGYLLRPLRTTDYPSHENAKLKQEFGNALHDTYSSKTPVILVIDESHHVQVDLKLKADVEQPLMRGAPVVWVWNDAQRGAYLSYHTYGAAEHSLLFHDPVAQNRQRYKDIGGVDPELLIYLTDNLELRENRLSDGTAITNSEAVYIRRAGPRIIIVGID